MDCTDYGVDSSMPPPTAQLGDMRNSGIDYVIPTLINRIFYNKAQP